MMIIFIIIAIVINVNSWFYLESERVLLPIVHLFTFFSLSLFKNIVKATVLAKFSYISTNCKEHIVSVLINSHWHLLSHLILHLSPRETCYLTIFFIRFKLIDNLSCSIFLDYVFAFIYDFTLVFMRKFL